MNFFEHQEKAERKTVRLVVLYTLGILFTFAAFHTLVVSLFSAGTNYVDTNRESSGFNTEDFEQTLLHDWMNPSLLAIDFGIVILIVGGGTLCKISQMKQLDGDGIAQLLGGVQVNRVSASPKERRLINIVEEMAIASGVTVPNVYVLRNEPGINAFAAGYTTATSVVAVTSGALDYLNRDELQGVIAHEFSHILHHDTNLDMKMIGILFGLEMLAITGFVMIRISPGFLGGGDSDDQKAGAGIFALLLTLGLGILIIGLFGQLFSNLIRAAVSRQREFLADASAVQYTRNPDGIAGALKKIGSSVGARIITDKAVDTSHIFFGNVFAPGFFSRLFDSHPDLKTRIRRIDPNFDGNFTSHISKVSNEIDPNESSAKPRRGDSETFGKFRFKGFSSPAGNSSADPVSVAAAAEILNSAGAVSEKKLRVADALLERIPAAANEAVQTSNGAVGALLAVLLDHIPELYQKEIEYLNRSMTPEIMENVIRVDKALENSSESVKIPIVQKAFPLLKQLPKEKYLHLKKVMSDLMKFDGKIDILEWTIAGFVIGDLDQFFRIAPPVQEKYRHPSQIAEPFRKAASFMAYAGSSNPSECVTAFNAAAKVLGLPLSLLPREVCVPSEFAASIKTLAFANTALRADILKALYSCITADGYINETEGELLRAVTAHFRCPMPSWE